MEIVLRSAAVFVFLWFLTRIIGKKELAEISAFELVLLVVIGDLVQQGVTQEDMSVTGAILATGTIALLVVSMSYVSFRWRRADRVVEGVPVVIVSDGSMVTESMRLERLTEDLHGFTYNGYLYIGMFVAFTMAICFWLYKGFFKQRTSQDLLIAPLFFWILVNGGVVYYVVGAGFFIIPVIVLLIILSLLIFSKKEVKPSFLFTFLAIPVLIIFAPLIKMFPVGLGLKMLVISTVFTVMLFGFLVPVFIQYKSIKKLSNIFFLIGGMLLISASLQASYSEDQKQPNSILYVVDANKNEANWVSYNATTDAFLSQFFDKNIEDGSNDNLTSSSKYKTRSKLRQKAELKPLERPIIAIVLDTIIEDNRKVCFSVTSLRNANYIEVITKTPVDFTSFIVNGTALKKNSINNEFVLSLNKGTIIKYYRTSKDEIMDLEFVVPKNQQFDLNILEIKYDLLTNPKFNIQPRTSEMMPTPFVLNDATVIQTNLKF